MRALEVAESGMGGALMNWSLRFAAIAAAAVATIYNPVIGAAIVYTLGFLVLAFRRPDIAILLVFASAPFQNDLSGGDGPHFSLAEVNLLLTLIAMIMLRIVDKRHVAYGPAFLPVAFYLAVCTLSSIRDLHDSSATTALLQMVLYLIVAVVVFSQFLPRQQTCLLALRGAVAVCVFLAIAQILNPAEYVLGLHKNGIGASLSCGLIIATDFWFSEKDPRRKRWITVALAIIAAGLIAGLSRGAWLAAAAGIGVLTAMRGEYVLFMRGALIVTVIFILVWSRLPSSAQDYAASIDPNRPNIDARYETISYAQTLFHDSPILGNGVSIRKDIDATNLIWITLAETGVIGLAAFLFMHAAFLSLFWRGYRMVPRDSLYGSVYTIASALLVAQFMHGLVDHYWSRGALMMVWAAVGMATGVTLRLGGRPAVRLPMPLRRLRGGNPT